MTTISVPPEYGYVLASLTFSTLLSVYHGILVSSERKKSGIPYPTTYATQEEAATNPAKYRFNCAQRAHMNYLENLPGMLVCSAIAGLEYPLATTGLGVLWMVGRVVYAKGYISSSMTKEGSGRLKGAFYHIGQLGLLLLSGYTAYQRIVAV